VQHVIENGSVSRGWISGWGFKIDQMLRIRRVLPQQGVEFGQQIEQLTCIHANRKTVAKQSSCRTP
jgi:hypothetical protein